METDRYEIIKFEEGFRTLPYKDSLGYPTIGYGTKIGKKGVSLSVFDFNVNEASANSLLIQYTDSKLQAILASSILSKAWSKCNEPRKAVLLGMAYQLGTTGLLKFKGMLAAITREDWVTAKVEGLDSLWARQTPVRANRQMEVLLTGCMDAYEGLIEKPKYSC